MMTLFQQEEVTERYGHECREEGAKNTLLDSVRSLMSTMHLTSVEAMDALRIPPEKQKELSALL